MAGRKFGKEYATYRRNPSRDSQTEDLSSVDAACNIWPPLGFDSFSRDQAQRTPLNKAESPGECARLLMHTKCLHVSGSDGMFKMESLLFGGIMKIQCHANRWRIFNLS